MCSNMATVSSVCDAPLTAALLLTLSANAKPLSAFWAGV